MADFLAKMGSNQAEDYTEWNMPPIGERPAASRKDLYLLPPGLAVSFHYF